VLVSEVAFCCGVDAVAAAEKSNCGIVPFGLVADVFSPVAADVGLGAKGFDLSRPASPNSMWFLAALKTPGWTPPLSPENGGACAGTNGFDVAERGVVDGVVAGKIGFGFAAAGPVGVDAGKNGFTLPLGRGKGLELLFAGASETKSHTILYQVHHEPVVLSLLDRHSLHDR
jgi:hypothetical protein